VKLMTGIFVNGTGSLSHSPSKTEIYLNPS